MASSKQQNLVDLRKKLRLSQQELGLRVAKELGIKWTEAAAQKRVSNWEAKQSLPDGKEYRALAKVLGVGVHELDTAIQRQKASAAQIPFERLADANAPPSFVAICFTAPPTGHHDPAILAAMQKGIASKKISFAMFVPSREDKVLSVEGATDPAIARHCALLNGYVSDVWDEVDRYFAAIRSGMKGQSPPKEFSLKNHLRMYQPKDGYMPFPPSGSRYCLVVQAPREGEETAYDEKLYLWVHTARLNDLELVDTALDGAQVKRWEAYYTGILTEWLKSGTLPEEGGFWRAVRRDE